MNILLPTDFSENADKAIKVAFNLAQKGNGKVHILHAYDLPYSDRSMSTSLLEIMRDNAEQNMTELEAKLKTEYGDVFSVSVRLGNPIRLIQEASDSDSIDLVVMGTKGASGLEEVLIGSNAASVIHGTNKPVLIIPPQSEVTEIKKIVFACDLDPKVKQLPLQRLADFAQVNGAKIDLVHVQKESAPAKGSREFYSSNLGEVEHEFTILNSDDVEKSIIAEAEKEGADVVAAISKRYGFFEGVFHRSMTNKLAYHSGLPLLVLHEPK
jgi:nucleotide-binding universal stress UspA family protein